MNYPATVEEFNACVEELRSAHGHVSPNFFFITLRANGYFCTLASNNAKANNGAAAIFMKVLGVKPEGVQSVVLDRASMARLLNYFLPFKGDGLVHTNLDAINDAWPLIDIPGVEVAVTFIFSAAPYEHQV